MWLQGLKFWGLGFRVWGVRVWGVRVRGVWVWVFCFFLCVRVRGSGVRLKVFMVQGLGVLFW